MISPIGLLQSALDGDSPPSCGSVDLIDLFVDGWFVKGWQCTMAGGDNGVMMVLSTFILGAVGLALWIATGSLAIPAVLGILLAGVLFATLPATAVNIALIALLLLLSAGGLLLTLRAGGR